MQKEKEVKKVLIDGAAGYLGNYLVREFTSKKYSVRATDLQGTNIEYAKSLGAEAVYSDLLNPESLDKVTSGIDWVVHSAAAFDLGLPYHVLRRINVDGTLNLCNAMLKNKVKKLLHISTGGVYGKTQCVPVTEEHRVKPIDAYSKSKLEAEIALQPFINNGIHTIIFRPTALYGPGGKYLASVFMAMPVIAREKEKLSLPVLSGGQQLNMVHVKDVASAAVHVLQTEGIKSGEVFNLAETSIMTAEEFFEFYYKSFGIKVSRRIKIPRILFNLNMAIVNMLASDFTLGPVNRWLAKTWNEIVKKYMLEPILSPHIVKDDLHFLAGDHAYSNAKLIGTGYKFIYPDFRKGFPETIKWYQDKKWIPSI